MRHALVVWAAAAAAGAAVNEGGGEGTSGHGTPLVHACMHAYARAGCSGEREDEAGGRAGVQERLDRARPQRLGGHAADIYDRLTGQGFVDGVVGPSLLMKCVEGGRFQMDDDDVEGWSRHVWMG